MSAVDWTHVAAIFEEALEVDPAERPAWLDRRCADQADLREEVEALLAAHSASEDFLQPPDSGPALPAFPPTVEAGAVFGAYRIVREIAHGGMGTVYLATRADDLFTHQVAIKVTRATVTDHDAARRFAVERQVLATLKHPHIVTLLDGGHTASGQAYFVMEYVEGQPITEWFEQRQTPIEQRLRLFRQVCSAVHTAHQHGVIHRDLKPANILVTADGVPKVLDFGVAKLLDPQAHATVTSLLPGPLTPNYASPEQLRGLPVTTASDVYSLGVLLFECLTGRRPYDITGKPVDEVLEAVTRPRTLRPSAAASAARLPYPADRLRGDLDAIVQKAMRVDPAERYGSAEELSVDVANHLGGKPVVAREPSFAYIAGKLAQRHRGIVAAVSAALLAVIAGLGVAVWQRNEALRERARAETQFEDTRKLANALLFKVHDAVAQVPGATEARRVIVNEALTYLDRLAASSEAPALRVELARGYKQVGRVQGDPQIPNLGDLPAAKASFEWALALLAPLLSEKSVGAEATLEAVHVNRLLSQLERTLGNRDASLAASKTALSLAESLLSRDPASDEYRRLLASAHFNVAYALTPGEDAMPHWAEAERLFGALLAQRPDDADRMRNVALIHKYVGGALQVQGKETEAAERYRTALELDERRLAANPDNHAAQFDVAIDLANVGNSLWKAGQLTDALGYYQRSVAMRERLTAADPKDALARTVLARVLATTSWVQLDLRHYDDAQRSARRVVELLDDPASGVKTDGRAGDLVKAWLVIAATDAQRGRNSSACAAFERARARQPVVAASDWRANSLGAFFERIRKQLPGCPAARDASATDGLEAR